MFDDDHRRAIRYKFIKHVQQHANIKRMQADCRSSNTNTASCCFRPISLANFKRWASPPDSAGVLAQRKIAQTQFMQRGKLRLDRFDIS